MNCKRKRSIVFFILFSLLIFLFVLTAFYPAGSCFFPAIVPDGTENFLAAYHLAERGKCGFFLNGIWHPSRYSFILPATFFVPWMRLFPGEMMAGVYGCFSAALLLLFALAGTGKILKSFPGVLFSIPLLLLLPQFIIFCNSAMTEIPYTALLLLLLFLFAKAVSRKDISLSLLIFYSLICAWAGGIRSTGYFMLFPFLLLIFFRRKEWKKRFFFWGITAIFPLLMIAGTLFYNYQTFGSTGRSGYHYWCPVPYDFPSLLFQFSYAEKNLPVLLKTGVLLPFLFFLFSGIIYIFLQRKKKEEYIYSNWKWCYFFVLFHYFILLFLYIFHYFCFERFFLPPSVLAVSMGGITVWRSIILFTGKRKRKKLVFFFSLSAVLIAGILNYLLPPVKLPVTYTEISLLKYCKDLLPEKSFLIVNFNPALSSFFLGKEQKILPFSRELEYAGKVIALEKISSAASFREKMPESAVDHSAALSSYPEKKVFLPFPFVVSESFPEKYRENKSNRLLTERFLSENKVFITNLAVYQIPEKDRERFMKETQLHTIASEGPVKLYRVYPALPPEKN